MSFALEGGREGPQERAASGFRFGALDQNRTLDIGRTAALRLAMRVDLEIQVPPQPSGVLPDIGAQTIAAIGDVLEGSPAFADVDFPSFEDRAIGERERAEADAVAVEESGTALIQSIVALEWEHTRNPPAVADLLTVTIPSRFLPIDLRVFDNIRIQAWPFVWAVTTESFQDRLDRCLPGDPGHFVGVVDNIEPERKAGRVTLTCRDLTAILLAREVSGRTMRGLDMRANLDVIIDDLIRLSVPGGDVWEVEPRGKLRTMARSPFRILADEKRKKVTRQKVVLVNHLKYAKDVEQLAPGEAYDPDDNLLFGGDLEGVTYNQQHSAPTAGGGTSEVRQWRQPHGVLVVNQDQHDGSEYEVRNVTRTITIRVPPTPEQVFESEKMTVWAAIMKVCRKLGVIPEVSLAEDGSPLVVLVDAEDYVDGRFFRAFRRFDAELGRERAHRIITFGLDIAELAESRDLTAGDRVGWCEVIALDPDTGVTRRERFGKPGNREGGTGIQIPYHGITNRTHLKRLARQAWLNANAGELQLAAEIDIPWTTGGGVDDPDLLQCAPGTLVEVVFAAAKRFRGNALEDILKSAPIYLPPQAAKVLGRASEAGNPSLVFQVAELVHSGSTEGDGSYSCSIALQALLDDGLNPEELETEDS